MERPEPITVSELNKYIKNIIDSDDFLNMVYIRGEISNFKNHYTGHMYFTLKDESSLIKCVMFKTYTANLNFEPQDGMSVVILGSVNVFERDGVYQIYVKGMEIDGIGALYAEYEKLKARLSEEGLFDEKNKKKIPFLPKAIGVVTSKTGAVIRDIINVTTRRYPGVHIKLYPVSVQGKGAAETIAKGIEVFNDLKNVDVIIIARGGGSLEDLWPFNEEITARAIYASKIPVISAVGHETDFTIADFVADLRAPTPSAAGELAVPNIQEVKWKILEIQKKFCILLNRKVELIKSDYLRLKNAKIFKNPYNIIEQRAMQVVSIEKQLVNAMTIATKNSRLKLVEKMSALDALSPLKTLARGYAIIENEDKNVLRTVNELSKQDLINIVLQDGKVKAKVIK